MWRGDYNMELQERLQVLTGIAQRVPGIGKTAMMKCAFFLQTIHKVPLNYQFEIYTYGPYSSEVMEELDYARQLGMLDIRWTNYPTGIHGYSISSKQNFQTDYDTHLDDVTSVFGSKTAKELELLSTILFVERSYNNNKWKTDKESICAEVQEIKPRFSLEEIDAGYCFMKHHGYIN